MGVFEGRRYQVYLRFHVGTHTNVFPIGERTYDSDARVGQTITLPHQQDSFYKDMPEPQIEEITPNPLIGEPHRLYAGIQLRPNYEDINLRIIVASLFQWYRHEEQNIAQRDMDLPSHSFAQAYSPATNYHEIMRRGVEKIHLKQQREQTLLNPSSLSERCQTKQRGQTQSVSLSESLQSKVGEPCA